MTQPAASSSSDLPAAVDTTTAAVLAAFTYAEQELLTALSQVNLDGDAVAVLIAMRTVAARLARRLAERVPGLVEQAVAAAARMADTDANAELAAAGVHPPPAPPARPAPPAAGRPSPHRVDLLRDLPPARRAEATDLTARLLATLPRFARLADDAYRAAVLTHAGSVLSGRGTTQLAQQAAWRQLTERGVTGFVDRSGRRWNLASYVEMATRTAVQRTYNAAHLERFVAAGISQVSVPSTGHPCPLCRPWEGRVLSIDPAGPSPTIAEAEAAGLHHPNCRHTWVPYVPGQTRLPRPKAWTETDARRYAATQRLRALEVEVRRHKRAALAATNDVDRRRATRNARAVQAQIRDHVARHDLVRRSRREQLDLGHRPPQSSGGGSQPPTPPPPARPTGGGGEPPDDEWRRRQDALAAQGVDFHGEQLEPHEIQFVERFLALGHRLDWIPRERPVRGTSTGARPTNDFVWLDNGLLVCELKATQPRFESIRGRISSAVSKAAKRGVVKDNFVIDLGDVPLSEELRGQLARYNADRREQHIARMWVMAAGRLEQIDLE